MTSQYGSQLCKGYVIKTVVLVSTRNTGTVTMRKWSAQVGMVIANVCSELSLLKMSINMANADYLPFFSMERTGVSLPTAGSGVPGVNSTTTSGARNDLKHHILELLNRFPRHLIDKKKTHSMYSVAHHIRFYLIDLYSMAAMKSTALFPMKTDRDNHRSEDSGVVAGQWSLAAVQYLWWHTQVRVMTWGVRHDYVSASVIK